MSGNPYELLARAEKVQKLVRVLDPHLSAAGVHPYGERAPAIVADFDELVWVRLARVAGVNMPSLTTRAAVIEIYRARPEHLQRVRSSTGV